MRDRAANEISTMLAEADRLLDAGRPVAHVLADLGISRTTYYRWRRRFDGATSGDIARIRDLERENGRLRRIVADKTLEIEALREISRGSY
jgi:putative transposase